MVVYTRKNIRQRILLTIILCFLPLTLMMLFSSEHQSDPAYRFSSQEVDVTTWLKSPNSFCAGNYVTHAQRFFLLRSAVYDPLKDRFIIPCGVSKLWHNPRTASYYSQYGEYAPSRYTKTLMFEDTTSMKTLHGQRDRVSNFTVAIYREYPHNFFHAMSQWYNVFLLSKLLKFDPKSVTILLLDKTPLVHIDRQWEQLYSKSLHVRDLRSALYLGNVLFSIAGHESLLYYFQLERLPFVEEFSKYFMDVFKVSNTKTVSCSNISVTLVLRHDYLMHPGNQSSMRNTERKFQNEAELVRTLKEELPGHNVRTLVAEDLPLKEQLKLTTSTDVLIGMHGCVLSQTLFLPRHAMVLEMYPIFWERKLFFISMSKWRGIRHDVWQNDAEEHEFRANCSTYVPPSVFRDYAKRVKEYFSC